jgi:hypothetical protein
MSPVSSMTYPAIVQQNEAASVIRRSSSQRIVPDAYRIVDWSHHNAAPPVADVDRVLGSVNRDGNSRMAVLVSTPKALMAANMFAERAGLLGAQVRVFVGASEAMAWLYRDLPSENLTHEWPVEREVGITAEWPADAIAPATDVLS